MKRTAIINQPTPEQFQLYSDIYKSYNGIRPRWIDIESVTWAELEQDMDNMEARAKAKKQEMVIRNVKWTTGKQFDSNGNVQFEEAIDPTNPFYSLLQEVK